MECFRCEQEAMQECPRCGAVYCDSHGETLCARCEDPALALPSYVVYRGSLMALLVGSVFAVWLLILPSAGADQVGPPSSLSGILPPPAESTASNPTATPSATQPSTASAGPEPTAEPTAEATAEPASEATAEPEPIRHVVTDGDSLFAIAARYAATGSDVLEYQDRIQEFNNISDPRTIVIGQVILVPPQ